MGIYTMNLLKAYTAIAGHHQFILLGNVSLGPIACPDELRNRCFISLLKFTDSPSSNKEILARFLNTAEADLYINPSPFEGFGAVTVSVQGLVKAKICSIFHDLIPGLYPEKYLPSSSSKEWYSGRMALLQENDFILSNSNCSRWDLFNFLDMSPKVVGNIGGGVDDFYFGNSAKPETIAISASLRQAAVANGLVYVGGWDWRKNEFALIEAYALLPAEYRTRHPLIFAHGSPEEHIQKNIAHAERCGVADNFHHFNHSTDGELRYLYENCHLFIFPSIYEGYGLPIAEAMVCGAAVIASNTSSMPEVCGEAALMIHDPSDTSEIAAKIESVLTNEDLRLDLKVRSTKRREYFRWERAASRMDYHLRRWMTSANTPDELSRFATSSPKPRIAVFSPLPPTESRVSEYLANLVPWLSIHYEIDLFTDDTYVPNGDSRLQGCRFFNHRVFPEMIDTEAYSLIHHQLSNSRAHSFQIEWLLRFPSVTMLHDLALVDLVLATHAEDQERFPDLDPASLIRAEVGESAANILIQNLGGDSQEDLDVSKLGLPLNSFVFRFADAVMYPQGSDASALARYRNQLHAAEIYEVSAHSNHSEESSKAMADAYRRIFETRSIQSMMEARSEFLKSAARLNTLPSH
jgi:hypothetical protein